MQFYEKEKLIVLSKYIFYDKIIKHDFLYYPTFRLSESRLVPTPSDNPGSTTTQDLHLKKELSFLSICKADD